MGFKPEDLKVFLLVTENRSVTGAADELQMAQQSVSDRVRILERVVGEPLFVRSPRGMELTAAGRRLLPYAERCLDVLDEALTAARSDTRGKTSNLLVHQAWRQPLASWTEGLSRDGCFAVRHFDGSSSRMVAALLDGTADVAVGPVRSHAEEITSVSLFIDPLVCIVPVASPLATEADLRMREMLVGDLATRGSGQECIVTCLWDDPSEPGLSLSLTDRLPVGAVDDGECSRTWVAAFCPRSMVSDAIDDGTVLEVTVGGLPPWSIEVVVAFRTADRDLPHMAALRDVVDAARSVLRMPTTILQRS